MQLPEDWTAEYRTVDPTSEPPRDFTAAVRAAARTFDCELLVDGRPLITITAADGFAVLFDRFGEPDGDVTFEELDLGDVPAGLDARAVIRRFDDGPPAPIVLALGDDLLHVDGIDVASGLARAIVAQAG